MFVCLFDIDGTLLNSGGAGRAALELAFCEEFGFSEMRGRVSYSGRTDRSIMREILHMHELDAHEEHFDRLIAGYLKRLPDSLQRNQGTVLPGVLDLLKTISGRQEKVAMGLLTGNIQAGARTKLGHFGLFDFFKFGGFGDLHWERDDVAREALEQVRTNVGEFVEPQNILVIGDTPLDVQCARAIGVKAIAVTTGWHSAEELQATNPDLLLADLSDPSPIVGHWE